MMRDGMIHELDVDLWDQTMAVNVRGYMLCTKHVVPHMLARGGGVIINTSSGAGLQGELVRAAYGTSKSAVIGFTRSVATQYGKMGIRCVLRRAGPDDDAHGRREHAAADDRDDEAAHADARAGRGPRTSPTRSSSSPPTGRRSSPARTIPVDGGFGDPRAVVRRRGRRCGRPCPGAEAAARPSGSARRSRPARRATLEDDDVALLDELVTPRHRLARRRGRRTRAGRDRRPLERARARRAATDDRGRRRLRRRDARRRRARGLRRRTARCRSGRRTSSTERRRAR